jgi:hypothetical protein
VVPRHSRGEFEQASDSAEHHAHRKEVADGPVHAFGMHLHREKRRDEDRDRRAPFDNPPAVPRPRLNNFDHDLPLTMFDASTMASLPVSGMSKS